MTYARTGTSSLQYVFFYAMGKSGVGANIMCIHKICLQWCLTDNFIQLPKNINSFIKAFGLSMFDDSWCCEPTREKISCCKHHVHKVCLECVLVYAFSGSFLGKSLVTSRVRWFIHIPKKRLKYCQLLFDNLEWYYQQY